MYLIKKNIKYYLCVPLFVFVFIFIIYGARSEFYQQYALLANAFSSGQLHFLEIPYGGGDTVLHNGKYYWPLGPFPAVLLIPFVWTFRLFGIQFYEAYLHFFIFFTTFILYYRIAKKLEYSQRDALFWASAFCFASPLIGIAVHPFSWYFAHNIASLLAALSIYLFLTKRSYWFIGILIGLTLATRLTAGLIFVFFVFSLLIPPHQKHLHAKLVALLTPIIMTFMLLGWYNHARFGNFFETGYNLQFFFNPALTKTREYGLFSLAHVPGNFYYMFLSEPKMVLLDGFSPVLKPPYLKPNPWGMGIFFTSPYLLYLLFLKYKDRLSRILAASILLSMLPIMLFFGIGYYQYGYRFALDFLPLVMLLLMRNYRKDVGQLSTRFRLLLCLAIVWNLYLVLAMFSDRM